MARTLWLVLLAAVVAAGGWVLGIQHARAVASAEAAVQTTLNHNPDLDPGTRLSGMAPNFVLTNQFGQPVSLRQFRGRIVVLAFVDSECTTVCPLTTTSMTEAVAMLPPKDRSRVALLGVDANPHATAVSDVYAYSAVHGVLHQWNFLTGTPAQLRKVWKAYGIEVAIVRGLIDHTPALYVVNAAGQERYLYLTQMSYAAVSQQAQVVATDIAHLLPGDPAIDSHLSYAWIRGETPTTSVRLPRLIPGPRAGSLVLGPGSPHLTVFVASWLRETSPLAQELIGLNAYVQAAARGASGLAPLTVVDEAPTEPTPTALATVIADLRQPLRYPVVVDQTGRLADGYGVEGLPYYVLTASSGRVLWQSSVYVPVPQLIQRVEQALQHA